MSVCSAGDLVLDDFEKDPGRWGKNLTLSTEHVKEGAHSLRWETTNCSGISRSDIPHDWTEYRAISWWMYSEKANGSQVMMTLPSNPSDDVRGNYYAHKIVIDWTGWKHFQIPFYRFSKARQVVGWDTIQSIRFNGQGWGQDKPVPGTVLYLDDMKLLSKPAEVLAAMRAEREAVAKGWLTPMANGHALLAVFARGVAWGMDQWQADPKDAWKPTWSGAVLSAAADASSRVMRGYDLDVSSYDVMIVNASVSKDAVLRVTVKHDGKEAPPAALKGRGPFLLPFSARMLQGLQFELKGAGKGADALIESIVLRSPERTAPALRSHHTRGVLLWWTRPSWGSKSYRVLRSRDAKGGNAEAIAPEVPAQDCFVLDWPAKGGQWFYSVVPVRSGGDGAAGEWVACNVADRPAPAIRRSDAPITVDGDLTDWADVSEASGFGIGPGDLASGEAPTSADDLSAKARLTHDDENLYVAVDVTDDVVRHESAFPWQGDGIVLLLAAAPPRAGVLPGQYDLVLNYTAGAKAQGRLLQDHTGLYPADKKPVAPGTWVCRIRPGGYVMEVAVPLKRLTAVGFRPEKTGLGLGLSIHDADQPKGETKRQSAISWNQRKNLYDVNEAALVRWQAAGQ